MKRNTTNRVFDVEGFEDFRIANLSGEYRIC